jgi:hypothetical protein
MERINDCFNIINCLTLGGNRWDISNERFKKNNIQCTKFQGYDGQHPGIIQEYKYSMCDKRYIKPTSYAILKGFLHMIKLSRTYIGNDNTYFYGQGSDFIFQDDILIFEDDVIFHKDFERLFNIHYNELPNDWDVWYLGGTQFGTQEEVRFSENLNEAFNLDGMFAIAIRDKFLSNLLLDINQYVFPLDTTLKAFFQGNPEFKMYKSRIPLCGHDYGKSLNLDIVYHECSVGNHMWYDREIYN